MRRSNRRCGTVHAQLFRQSTFEPISAGTPRIPIARSCRHNRKRNLTSTSQGSIIELVN